MAEEKYETSKLEFGDLQEASKDQMIEIIQLANQNRARSNTDMILKLVDRFGEEVWGLIREQQYQHGLRRAEIYDQRMKASGMDRFLPDPRVIRREVRTVAGVLGIAHHFGEVMEGDPATGRFKLTYEIDHCPHESWWRNMGLPSEIRQKLCWCQGNATDTAGLDYFGIWLYEDMGLAKQKPTCTFIMYGPKTKQEHEAWGNSLPPELKKYYHPWPWCK